MSETIDLDDSRAVMNEARRQAYILLNEGYQQNQDRSNWRITVNNQDGMVVLNLTLQEIVSGSLH